MSTFIVLLRGINVGGNNKIPMTDLRKSLSNRYKNVQSYIQSGNLILESEEAKTTEIEKSVAKIIQENFGFSIEVLAYTFVEFQKLCDRNPFMGERLENSYYCLLKQPPERSKLEELADISISNEFIESTNKCIYLYFSNGYGRAKMNNNFLEKKLNVIATNRNHRTMQKLLTLATEK